MPVGDGLRLQLSQFASIFNTMRFFRLPRFHMTAGILALTLVLGLAASAHASTRSRRRHHAAAHSTGRHASLHRASYRRGRGHRLSARHHAVLLGQRAMDPQRATEIQQALIQAHYLNGSPTGQWDPDTQAAMQKYQADNGWQTKITPDSRAIIKLGLGPKQDEGEYSSNATGISRLSDAAAADPIRTMATSEMPATTQN